MSKIYLSSTFERMKELAKDKPISVALVGEAAHPNGFVDIIGVERGDPALSGQMRILKARVRPATDSKDHYLFDAPLKHGEFGIRGNQDSEGRLEISSFNLINTPDK